MQIEYFTTSLSNFQMTKSLVNMSIRMAMQRMEINHNRTCYLVGNSVRDLLILIRGFHKQENGRVIRVSCTVLQITCFSSQRIHPKVSSQDFLSVASNYFIVCIFNLLQQCFPEILLSINSLVPCTKELYLKKKNQYTKCKLW